MELKKLIATTLEVNADDGAVVYYNRDPRGDRTVIISHNETMKWNE